MQGTIAFANPARGRYAVRTEAGDYIVFEMTLGRDLAVGDVVTGSFDTLTPTTYQCDRHGEISVTPLGPHGSLDIAKALVFE